MDDTGFDEPGPCLCGKTKCPCPRCHGARWIDVQPNYAVHLYPDPTMEQLAEPDVDPAAMWAQVLAQRVAALNSVYPCRECCPGAFFRWAGGHFEANHQVADCDECIEALGGKRAAQRAARAHAAGPAERKDVNA